MFFSRNKKNNVYPCKPQFYYIKVGLRGSELYRYVFVMTQKEFDECTVSQSDQGLVAAYRINGWGSKYFDEQRTL